MYKRRKNYEWESNAILNNSEKLIYFIKILKFICIATSTRWQNILYHLFLLQITQLKIDYNPFAKGFRDNGMGRR